jgi:hypothetical protein
LASLACWACEFHPQDCSRIFRTTLEEYDAFTNISPAQVRATGNLGELPLIVIAHDPAAEIALEPSAQVRQDEAIDLQMQRELRELSTRGCLLIAVGSRHYIQDARPDLALKSLESSSKVQAPRSQSIVYATESAESFQINAPNSKAHLVHNVHESPYIRLCDF